MLPFRTMLLVLSCALMLPVPASARNAWTHPHELRISDAGNPTTLNPHLSQNASTANLSEPTMAWLVRWDARNQPYPELATKLPTAANGGISADGMTITYHLRRGVKWSDGAPFDARDVAFSIAAVNNPANDEGGRFDQIARVETPDSYTVVIHLKRRWGTFLEALFSSCCANPSLLPRHLLAGYSSINKVAYNDLPVGIGPFRFTRWDKDKDVVMEANPLYWRGRPKLDRVVYEIIPTRDDLLQAMRDHRVDLWYQFSGAYLDRVHAIDGYSIARRPSYAYNHLDFNLTRTPLDDVRVRRALRFALDRNALLTQLSHGVGIVQDSALPVSAPYFHDMGTAGYDPAQAQALLDAAGWVRGADGIRAKAGHRLVLEVATSEGQSDTDHLMDAIKSQWERVGATLHVTHYPGTKMFLPAQQGGVIFGSNWDIVFFAWAADPMGDYSGEYACDQFPPKGSNNVRWCNPRAQAAMQAVLGDYDQAQRNADVQQVMRAFIDDAPSIVTQMREDLFASNTDLQNYRPNTVTPFDNLMGVDI